MFLPLGVGRLLRERKIPYLVTVHDFYPVCPSFNLLHLATLEPCCPASCGNRERTDACQRALFKHLGHPVPADPVAFVEDHRIRFQALFDGAERVLFPSDSTRRITSSVLRLAPGRAEVLPHGYDAPARDARRRAPAGGTLRIALVGQVAYPSKGSEAYLRLIEKTAGQDVEWHIFGNTDLFDFEARLSRVARDVRVVRHGAYDRDTIVPKLVDAGAHLAVLLPVWPETFSYTLSEALAAGLPVVARRIGALEDRLDGAPYAVLVGDADEAARVVTRLVRDRQLLKEMAASLPAPSGTADWAARHRELFAECEAASGAKGVRATSSVECLRLNELAVMGEPPPPTISVTTPSPEYASSLWFRYAERWKAFAPETLRHVARRRLARDRSVELTSYRLPGPAARLGGELSVKRRYLSTTLLVARGPDPFLLLDISPFDPRTVDSFRFNMWCSTPHAAFAQLYFRHEGRRDFDEDHSAIVPLNGNAGSWQEYVYRFDPGDRKSAWYDGGQGVSLRFDPINVPGLIGLGELALCTSEVRAREEEVDRRP